MKLLPIAAIGAVLALSAPAMAACAPGNICGAQILGKGFGDQCAWIHTDAGTFGEVASDQREVLLLSFNKGDTVTIKSGGVIACQGSAATPLVQFISNDPKDQ